MNQRRIKMTAQLEVARELVRAYFDVPECAWDGRFHRDQRSCRQCADAHTCEWLFTQDPAPDLALYSQAQIDDALSFAAGYLQGRMLESDHAIGTCSCANCAWARATLALITDPG